MSESTPGPLAVNLSTYIGAETGGLLGSFCATVGVVLPSFVIILLVAKFYQAFQTNTLVKGCMNGLRPTVVGMIGASLLSVGASAFPAAGGVMQWVLAAVLLAAILVAHWKKVHPHIADCGLRRGGHCRGGTRACCPGCKKQKNPGAWPLRKNARACRGFPRRRAFFVGCSIPGERL